MTKVIRKDKAIRTLGDKAFQVYGNITIDGPNGRFFVKASDGKNQVLIGKFNDGITNGIRVARDGFEVLTCTDAQLVMSSEFTQPRETNIGFGRWNFTDVNTYEDLIDCSCQIDFSDWPDSSVYLEITGKTGAGTAYFQLYNSTDAEAIAGSEASTTSTSTTVFRSGAMTKPSGSKLCFLQYKIVGGGAAFCDIYTSRVVMRYV